MKQGIENGVGVVEVEVTDEVIARLDGRVIHPVYSTYWLTYHAEVAARRAIEPFFEDHEDGVGAEISLRHHAMAGIGARVTVEAKVTEIKGNKVVCSITATAAGSSSSPLVASVIVASGFMTQFILPKEVLRSKVERAITAS